jgi:hypothetical protein
VALRYGPISLVALDPRHTFLELDPRKLTPLPDRPLHFELDGIEFAPFYEGSTKAYHAYFQRSVPSGRDGGAPV